MEECMGNDTVDFEIACREGIKAVQGAIAALPAGQPDEVIDNFIRQLQQKRARALRLVSEAEGSNRGRSRDDGWLS